MKPYIFLPKPYYHHSGGVRALHYLCHHLNECGYEAYLTGFPTNPRLNTPYIDEHKARILIESKGAVAVYPERVRGNPFQAERVARILLHRPGYFDSGEYEFDKNETVFAYTKLIAPDMPEENILHIPCINTGIFNNRSNYASRFEKIYFVGKGKMQFNSEIANARELTLEEYPTREHVADALKRCEVFYSFDDYSLVIWEARLCGCPVVLYPQSFTKEQYAESEYGLDGTSWGGESELRKATQTLEAASIRYNKIVENFPSVVKRFVEMTQ